MKGGGSTDVPIATIFKRLLDQLQDSRCIIISTSEGTELYSASKSGVVSPEDSQMISSYVPCYAASIEQAKRLNCGDARYAMLWTSSGILIQTAIDVLIINILCDENANLGIFDEYINIIHTVLTPLCQGFLQTE